MRSTVIVLLLLATQVVAAVLAMGLEGLGSEARLMAVEVSDGRIVDAHKLSTPIERMKTLDLLHFIELRGDVSLDPPEPESEESKSEFVRVIFIHRHPRFLGSRPDGCLDGFTLEAVGHPFVEALPRSTPSDQLYRLVNDRFQSLLRAPVQAVQAGPAQPREPVVVTEVLGPRLLAAENNNEALLAGEVPSFGFVLRQISSSGNDCSLCHWLQRCSGCPLPDPRDK